VYETLNLAALWRLPLLIVLEDNGWSQSKPSSLNLAGDIGARFSAFGLPVVEVDTTDMLEIGAAADEAVTRCRSGGGPAALVVHTYRLCHHSKTDDNRPIEEVKARWAYDPRVVHGARLASDDRASIELEVEAALENCVAEARQL
jgi:TPP-dependent pyruvate/acetoin dehydrogenase alpha subunit